MGFRNSVLCNKQGKSYLLFFKKSSMYIEGVLSQLLGVTNVFPQSHIETAFRMVSGLYSGFYNYRK